MACLPECCKLGKLGCGSHVLQAAFVGWKGWGGTPAADRLVQEQAHRVGTWLSVGSITLTATRLKTSKPFLRNQVTSVSRTKALVLARQEKGLSQWSSGLRRCCGILLVLKQHQMALKYWAFLAGFLRTCFNSTVVSLCTVHMRAGNRLILRTWTMIWVWKH